MCGRFVLDRVTSDLVALFDVDIEGDDLPAPSWNIAPTQQISVVIDSLPRAASADDFPEPVRRLEAARWGLVPGFTAGPASGPPLFNARSEGLAGKTPFEASLRGRRAVVPASGYFEWSVIDGQKTANYISLPGDELVLFAGLFDWWKDPNAGPDDPAKWLLSATILTRASTGALASVHDRMPVFLDADVVEEWLDPQSEGSQELVDEVAGAAAFVADRVVFHAVDPGVGSVQNNGPELINPLT
jgi:putative SOS response-associated peptidase YedK